MPAMGGDHPHLFNVPAQKRAPLSYLGFAYCHFTIYKFFRRRWKATKLVEPLENLCYLYKPIKQKQRNAAAEEEEEEAETPADVWARFNCLELKERLEACGVFNPRFELVLAFAGPDPGPAGGQAAAAAATPQVRRWRIANVAELPVVAHRAMEECQAMTEVLYFDVFEGGRESALSEAQLLALGAGRSPRKRRPTKRVSAYGR